MHQELWRRVALLSIAALLLAPLQAGATALDPGSPADARRLAFAPDGVELQISEYASGFMYPVHVTNASDGSGRLFVSEQRGVVRIVQDGQALPEPFLDISEIVRDEDGEQGFFSIEFHPDFVSNGYFYAVYTKEPDGADVLARFEVSDSDPNQADPDSLREILTLPDRFASHNGGDIAFGPDGYLYYSAGDEGDGSAGRANAQNPQSLFGKMLRLDVDSAELYAIPPDNPFVDDPDVLDEIWSLGLRNPWRFSFDPATGDFYIGDVGQSAWEEIDLEPAGSPGGLNYGWALMEGFDCFPEEVEECDSTGLTEPILTYSHAGGQGVRDGCTVVGGEVYRGAAHPFMDGAYIFADWCEGRVWAGYRDADDAWRMTELIDTFINWTSVGADESGELYGTDLIGGRLFRFTFSRVAPTLSTVSPGGALVDAEAFSLTLHGTGFTDDHIVLWNDAPLQATFSSSEQIVAEAPAAYLTEPGVAHISLQDPVSGARTEAVPFLLSETLFGDPAFENVWSRTDSLVDEGAVPRTWIWGPEPSFAARFEPYAESPDGWRIVLYFDKSRMEITYPSEEAAAHWYVTNGLLVVEMMTGEMQVGDDAFVQLVPAQTNVAGDANDPLGVTYATLAALRDAPTLAQGALITTVLAADGTISSDGALAQLSVRAGPLSTETGHRTASVFWDFMTAQGLVLDGGTVQTEQLFANAYFATGFPVTEAYWTTVRVAGIPTQVLLQCFERRCLTYTPTNASGWRVEAGNVGRHYQAWRYAQ